MKKIRIFMHTGITKKMKQKTVFAVTIFRKYKDKTFYIWLPFNTGIYKTFEL